MEKEFMVVNADGKIFWHGEDAIDAEIEMDSADESFPGEGWVITEVEAAKIEVFQLRAWSCLTEEERKVYADRFYELWAAEGFGEPDYEATTPWGCPWDWYDGEIISADELFEAYKDEIKGYLDKGSEVTE